MHGAAPYARDVSESVAVQRLIDRQEIADLVMRYCRGIDRCDLDLVRRCYHPDATDDHGGDYSGGVDGFIEYVGGALARYVSTMHVVGNVLVEFDDSPDVARVESYVVAYHRVAASTSKPERDVVIGLRYVDDVVRRDGEWRIAARDCVIDWTRTDPVSADGWRPDPAHSGRRDRTDPVYRPLG